MSDDGHDEKRPAHAASDVPIRDVSIDVHARKPVIFAVDAGVASFGRIEYGLRRRYGVEYQVICETSAMWGMKKLRDLRAAGEEVALILADQWMPDITGDEFLARASQLFPTAKRAVLVEWGDRRIQEPVLRAMTVGHIDYYVNKPERPGDEYFHRMIAEFIYDWAKAHRPVFAEIRVVGEQWSARSHELKDILNRNGVLHEFHAADTEVGREILARIGKSSARFPVVVIYDGQVLEDPSNAELVDALGVNRELDRQNFDLVIVGAGPAGLAAAVYGASEGLGTLVLEGEAIGGQAGTSSLIRNYLGFPWGVAGAELAMRATEQAWWFGAVFRFMRNAVALRSGRRDLTLTLSDGAEVTSRAVVLATGVSYRRLGVPSLEEHVGMGVFYGAAVSEAQAMKGEEVFVVGGANSAGQAAVHLSEYASRVTLLVRGRSLETSMSDYLIKEIEAAQNIQVRFGTQVVGGGGEGRLDHLVLKHLASGLTESVPAAALFVLIGAEPRTGWLPEEIVRDQQGYIVTGPDLLQDGEPLRGWPLGRPPLPMETSMPGVFAAGDVRYGSVKRVASAVGAGAIAIQSVHEHFVKARLGLDSAGTIARTSARADVNYSGPVNSRIEDAAERREHEE
jgi:thioredoxin reductase (NADPH)